MRLRTLLLSLGLAAAPASGWALDETHVYGIANFDGAGECTNGSTHARHTTTAANFALPFLVYQPLGLWDETSTRNNLDARGSYFTDASKAGACACTADDLNTDDGIDDADVMFVHTHGGHSSTASPPYTNLAMGNSTYDCSVRTSDNFRLGQSGGDLDIAVVKACQSGDYEVWQGGGYRPQITDSTSSLTVWNAFHGNSSCSSATETNVSSYAWGSLSDGVGENWIDIFYVDEAAADDDDCPTSIVMGSSNSVRMDMYNNGGFWDRKDTGTKSGSTIVYIGGCDPGGGIVLPNG